MYKARGFTIVELLIVIVVIGILAAISIVSYNNVSARANDSRVREGVAQFEKALKMWSAETGDNTPLGGSGSTQGLSGGKCPDGSGMGFVGRGVYACTAEEILSSAGYLPLNFTRNLPSNTYYGTTNAGSFSIMFYGCGGNGRYLLLWTLRGPSDQDFAARSEAMSACGRNPTTDLTVSTWGMRGAKVVQL